MHNIFLFQSHVFHGTVSNMDSFSCFKCGDCFQVFTKVGVEEELMRRATELKKSLENTLRKQEHLHIDYKNRERRVVSLLSVAHCHQQRAPLPNASHITI